LTKNEKFEKVLFWIQKMHLNIEFYHPNLIGVAVIERQKMAKMEMAKKSKFHENLLKNLSIKKYFWTIFNFQFLKCIPKIIFLSKKKRLFYPLSLLTVVNKESNLQKT